MKTLPLIACLLWVVSVAAAEPARILTAAQWDRPRSGDFVAGIPVLRETVAAFDRHPGRTLTLRHPGGEAGLLWAEELRGWLVALGLPSARIRLAAGGGRPDALELIVHSEAH